MKESFLLGFLLVLTFGVCESEQNGEYVTVTSFIITISILSSVVLGLLFSTIYLFTRLLEVEEDNARQKSSQIVHNDYADVESEPPHSYEDTAFPDHGNDTSLQSTEPATANTRSQSRLSRSVKKMISRPPMPIPRDPPPLSLERYPDPPKTKYPTPHLARKDNEINRILSDAVEKPDTSQRTPNESNESLPPPVPDRVTHIPRGVKSSSGESTKSPPPALPDRGTHISRRVKSESDEGTECPPPALPHRGIGKFTSVTHAQNPEDGAYDVKDTDAPKTATGKRLYPGRKRSNEFCLDDAKDGIYDLPAADEPEDTGYEVPLPVKDSTV